jgi:hypothetical protein
LSARDHPAKRKVSIFRHVRSVTVAVLVGSLAAGCGSTSKTVTLPPPDLSDLADSDAIIVTTSIHRNLPTPKGFFPIPSSSRPDSAGEGAGEGALSGAGKGAVGALAVGVSVCDVSEPISCSVGIILGAIAAVPAAAIGAGIGASNAQSEENVDPDKRAAIKEAQATYRKTADDLSLLPTLDDRVATRLREVTPARWRCVGVEEPGTPQPCPDAERPAKLVLEPWYGHFKEGENNPDITLVGMVDVELVPASGEAQILNLRYASVPQPFFTLTKNNGALLKTEIDAMIERLAKAVAQEMLLDPKPGSMVISCAPVKGKSDNCVLPTKNVPRGVVRRVDFNRLHWD